MEPQTPNQNQPVTSATEPWHAPLNKVTTVSKILAAIVFITLPFLGFWLGMGYGEKYSVSHTDEMGGSELNLGKGLGNEDDVNKENKSDDIVSSAKMIRDQFSTLEGLGSLYVLKEFPFTFQNQPGAVYLLCNSRQILTNVANESFCFGDGMILMEVAGKRTVIEEFQIDSFEKVFSLSGVAFAENQFITEIVPYSYVTSTNLVNVKDSTASSSQLYIVSENIPCAKEVKEVFCNISDQHISHVVSFPTLEVRKVTKPKESKMFAHRFASFGEFLWNDKGTKAVFFVPCIEGCPDTVAEGYSLVTGVATKLLEAKGGGSASRLEPETVHWVSSSVVEINGLEYSF